MRKNVTFANIVLPLALGKLTVTTGFFTHDLCGRYDQGEGNPESARRIVAIEEHMLVSGLDDIVAATYSSEASLDDVLRVHDAAYIERLRDSATQPAVAHLSEDTAVNAMSFSAAMKSAGAAIDAVKAVCTGTVRNAFACVRPPGHHAGRSRGHGFCLINSVACAAYVALEQLGLERVAILDFDVHRADGTEEIVQGDSRIALFNLYQDTAFPFNVPACCSPNVLNTPLPEGTDGKKVFEVIHSQWLPRLVEFRPDLILLSAGFDAHRDEKQALFKLTEFDYSLITSEVMRAARSLCNERVVSILEGGYNLRSLASSVVAHLATLTRPVREA